MLSGYSLNIYYRFSHSWERSPTFLFGKSLKVFFTNLGSAFIWEYRSTGPDAHDWKSIYDTLFLPLPWDLKIIRSISGKYIQEVDLGAPSSESIHKVCCPVVTEANLICLLLMALGETQVLFDVGHSIMIACEMISPVRKPLSPCFLKNLLSE